MKIKESISNFIKYGSWQAKIVVFGGGAIFAVVIIIAVVFLVLPRPKSDGRIVIANYDDTTNASKDFLADTQMIIWDSLKDSLDLDNVLYEDAVIRDGSYKEEIEGDLVHVRMIIDIERIRQSAEVEFTYNKTVNNYEDPNVGVSCPSYEDVIYTDVKCAIVSPKTQVERYLPYYDTVGDNTQFWVVMKSYAGSSYLSVRVRSCGNSSLEEEAVQKTKSWLKKRYLDPNDYSLRVLDICGS